MSKKSLVKILEIAISKGVTVGGMFPLENPLYRMCITEEGTRFMHPVPQTKRKLLST